MNRSKRYAFVAFCTLAQGVRASGIVRKYPAVVKPIIDVLMENKINIFQMPCPELFFDSFHRSPCQKGKYDTPQNRQVYKQLAESVVEQITMLQRNGNSVEVIIGVERSPSCAVCMLTAPHRQIIRGEGIFIEEIKKVLHKAGIKVPFIGFDAYDINNSIKNLKIVMEGS